MNEYQMEDTSDSRKQENSETNEGVAWRWMRHSMGELVEAFEEANDEDELQEEDELEYFVSMN